MKIQDYSSLLVTSTTAILVFGLFPLKISAANMKQIPSNTTEDGTTIQIKPDGNTFEIKAGN